MNGAATTNLNGSALAVYDTSSCNAEGYYARIKEIRYSGNAYEDLQAIALSPAEIELAYTASAPLTVIGIYSGGATGVINPADLTYTIQAGGSTYVTVNNDTGIVTAKSANGTADIEISVTSKPDIVGYAEVTVSNT